MKKTNFTSVSQLTQEISSIDVQEMLMTRAKNAVLTTAIELMEQDMERLCGKPFARKSGDDLCHRGGSEMTSLMVDGAKLSVRRPRVRKNGEEIELPSLEKMRDQDLLDRQIGVAKTKMKNVKNWNYHSKMKAKVPRDKASRWVAMAIQSHREKMRRLRGGKEQMKILINKLNGNEFDSSKQAA